MCMRALTYIPNTFNTKFGKHLRAPALLVKPLKFQCNIEFWKKPTSWNTGSHCSLIPMASAFPVTSPSGSTVKYFPYPDFKAIFVSDTCTAVNISSASGPSPVQILRTCSTMLRLNALKSQNFKTKFKFYLSDLANDSEESTNLMNNFSKIGLHTFLFIEGKLI